MADDEAKLTATRTMAEGGLPRRRVRSYRLRDPGGESYVFAAPRVRIGRRPECELYLDDSAVSRAHVEITADEHGYRMRDLGSRNGTLVDGVRAHDVYLRAGSTLRIGRTALVFEPLEEETDVPASDRDRFGPLLGRSLPMRELFATLERVAPSDASVLVTGETGVGKELVARAIHEASERAGGPYVVLDCAAISPSLLESELFGHEKGAFTGASARRDGLLQAADGGTLFLDELGELPLDLQPKLLRAIENREARRVGGQETESVDVRFVAATNRDLLREVNGGGFRADLYYRLAVVEITVPALRERPDDVPLLVEHAIRGELRGEPERADRVIAAIDDEQWRELRRRSWGGNVRELNNHVLRELVLGLEPVPELAPGREIEVDPDLDRPLMDQKRDLVARFEQRYLEGQLARHDGNVSAAARAAGMDRMYFKRLLKKRR